MIARCLVIELLCVDDVDGCNTEKVGTHVFGPNSRLLQHADGD
jgi:hypothetical protein